MLPEFSSTTRLYDLSWRDGGPAVLVEAWWGQEALSQGFELCLDVLATDAHLELKQFLGKALTLHCVLPDGTRVGRSGLVRAAFKLGSDGGFTRHRLVVVPWTWLLTQTRHNRVFQDKSVVQIVEQVFGGHDPFAAWHWADEVAGFLDTVRPRSYCVQYAESDYAFISRLLAEEGLGWCMEEDEAAPAGHRMRLFADSGAFPEDIQSQAGGIRFHRADSQEESDAIVALGAHRKLGLAVGTTLSYDYKAKGIVATSLPSLQRPGGHNAPVLEDYDDAGLYAYADRAEAEHYAGLMLEAREARFKTFIGRGTVRSFRPGLAFTLSESTLDALVDSPDDATDESATRFGVRSVLHVGINNLSGEAMADVARRLSSPLTTDVARFEGEAEAPTADIAHAPGQLPDRIIELACERGYGNQFDTQRLSVPWRPVLADGTGERINPRPTAPGPMTAIVVGPQGETAPSGADELYCDRLGRIKVRFHWQQGVEGDDTRSCWLRLASRQAGAGMGWQFLPRIGQEVLVGFMNQDIDRPLVIGALYNGRGEGGVAPTPGGEAGAQSDTSGFAKATDHSPSAQGNLSAGNSPAWHGGAPTDHGHAAALTGFRTKEFGAHGSYAGYNQLVFDDTDNQQRVQLKSTESTSELNLGHLIHQADNYRGSFRGTGVELRTDAWGALRAGSGLLMSTWAKGSDSEPAGDNSAGMALLKQATTLGETLSGAAKTHQTVQLASALGTQGAHQSAIDPDAAPLKALHTVASGMVAKDSTGAANSDANAKNTAVGEDKVPHLTDAAIVQAAKAGLAMVAGQNLQWTVGETATLMSGQDTNFAIAGKTRIHTGQAIGLLAGAIAPGEGNTGIKLIAAQGDIDVQAQSDEMKFQSKKDLKLVSASANIDFAAAKKIVMSVGGGASITIDGGVTVQCPGTITVHASKKSFSGPTSLSREMNTWPQTAFGQEIILRLHTGEPATNRRFEILREDGSMIRGTSDSEGRTGIQKSSLLGQFSISLLD